MGALQKIAGLNKDFIGEHITARETVNHRQERAVKSEVEAPPTRFPLMEELMMMTDELQPFLEGESSRR